MQRTESLGNRLRIEGFFVANRVGVELAHQNDVPRWDVIHHTKTRVRNLGLCVVEFVNMFLERPQGYRLY